MSNELEPIERRVMEMILVGSDPVLDVLREQFRVAQVAERTKTGVGFFTKFSVPPEIPRVKDRKLSYLSDVKAEIEGVQHGAGFVLHLDGGALDCLEGSTYEGPWPANIQNFRVSYIDGDGDVRDLAALWEKWAG